MEDEIKIKPKTETHKNGSQKAEEECLKERSRSRSSRKLSLDSLGSDSEYIDSPPSKCTFFTVTSALNALGSKIQNQNMRFLQTLKVDYVKN